MVYDVDEIRSRFPSLSRRDAGQPAAYLDGPGGTQVPQTVIDAMAAPLRDGLSNLGGGYDPSDLANEITSNARKSCGLLLNADPRTISFGQNMTSLTFALSRALANTWKKGDAIVLTSLDHDANFTPWERAARERGVEVRIADFDPETGALEPEEVTRLIDDRVRLVATCLASNSIGTVVDLPSITGAAHEVGALAFVDAVHGAPHRSIDVASIGCDFLAASAYKFFGPHTGLLYGTPEQMASLDAYKVRPAPSDPPGKWETGTQSFESLAGVAAAIDHIASLGEGVGRAALESAFEAISEHEQHLGRRFIDGLDHLPHVRLYGVPTMSPTDRVATFAIGVDGVTPDAVAKRMIEHGIYVWSGHYYAVNAMDRLGVLDEGGLVRVGFVHYNTTEEVDRVLEVLQTIR